MTDTSATHRPQKGLVALWRALIEPPPSVAEPWRDRARLLSGLLVAMIGVGLLSNSLLILIILFGGPAQTSNLIFGMGSTILLAWVYRLNRKGRYSPAALLTILITNGAIWGAVAASTATLKNDSIGMAFLTIPVLLSSLLLSRRFTIALAIINLVIAALINRNAPGLSSQTLIYSTIFISLFSAMFVVVAILRDRDITERRMAEAKFRGVVEAAPDAIVIINAQGAITLVNSQTEKLFGYTREALLGRPVEVLLTESLHAKHRQFRAAYLENPMVRPMGVGLDLYALRKDGTAFPVEISLSPMESAEGKVIAAAIRDVTERRKGETALQEANDELQRSVAELEQHSREITLLSELGRMLQTCQSAVEAYEVGSGFARRLFPDEAGSLYIVNHSRNYLEVVAAWSAGSIEPDKRVFALEDCWALRRGQAYEVNDFRSGVFCQHVAREEMQETSQGYVCLPMTAQGETLGIFHLKFMASSISPAPSPERREDSKSKLALAGALAEQITLALANLKLRETLRAQSIRDPLTGLFNRRYMQETFERELRRAERNGYAVGVIMIDIDHFKLFNDSFGHGAGDAVLHTLGELLKANTRGGDLACRYGGEELTLILPEITLETIQERAEALCENVRQLSVIYHGQYLDAISISLGAALYPTHGATAEAVLRAADGALYQAKQAGRDRVVVSA